MNKKAIFFTIDALIALIIILFAVLVIYPAIKPRLYESSLSGDIIKVLSSLKIGEINNSYVQQTLIPSGRIADLNKTILEQIGEFYVTNITAAKELSNSVLSTINERENIGLWYGSDLIASRNLTSMERASNIEVDRQIISGIQQGGSLTGFRARAYLTSGLQKKYFYFGGYIGDGNISVNVNYIGEIKNMSFEITTNRDFKLYINGENAGQYDGSPSQFQPRVYSDTGYESLFRSGQNTVEFVGVDGNLFIAGGFMKITYNGSGEYEEATKHNLPGINGVVNLYDGFYVPGDLNNLEFNITARVNDPTKNLYVRMGNKLLFNDSTGGGLMNIYITDAQIRSILADVGEDYSYYSKKTIPIRVAVEGIDYVRTRVDAHVMSVNGISGAMSSIKGDINRNGVIEGSERGIDVMKYVNHELVDNIIDPYAYSYVGLSTTKSEVFRADYSVRPTTRDKDALHTVINTWSSSGGGELDICAAMQDTIDELSTKPIKDSKFMVNLIYKMPNSCNGKTSGEEIKQEIINILCQPSIDYQIKIYNVEVNLDVSAAAERVKEAMIYTADPLTCYGGKYYDGDSYLGGDLVKIYDEIVTDILSLVYDMQTVDVITSSDVSSYLSPGSYIKFGYTRESIPYGIISTNEKQFTDSYQGSFNIPENSEIVETRVISYSGSRWTQNVFINDNIIYNLSSYGSSYTLLGDPYTINIRNPLIDEDDTNTVRLTTGISPVDSSYGSEYNKIIYTSAGIMPPYSPTVEFAEGCNWTIKFETGAPVRLKIPEDYSGAEECYYGPDCIEAEAETYCGPYCVTPGVSCEDSDDAIQIAVYYLLESLDYDDNDKINIDKEKFTEENMLIDFRQITGIPFTWGTEVQVRKWD